jgi:alpha-L-rhamnosidase
VGELTWAWADFRSVRGRITSKWRREGSRLSLGVSIPANTTATVYVPARDASVVTEGDRPAGQSPDVRFLRLAEGCAVYAVGSGDYSFASTLP